MSYVKDIRLVQRGWKEQGNQGAYIIIHVHVLVCLNLYAILLYTVKSEVVYVYYMYM